MSKVSEVLRGSKRAEMKALRLDQLSTYGIMKDYSDKALKEFMSSLIADRYIEVEGLQYPILQVSELGKKALKIVRNRSETSCGANSAKTRCDSTT